MNALLKPTDEARAAFKAIGTSVDEVKRKIGEEGLTKTMIGLVEAADGNVEILAQLIPNVRALAGVLGTAGAQAVDYADIIDKMNTSHGILSEGFEIVSKTMVFQANQMWAQIKRITTELGMALFPTIQKYVIPVVKSLINWMGYLVDIFRALPEPIKLVVLGLAAITAAIGPLLIALGTIVTAVGAVMASWGVITATLGGAKAAIIALSGTALPALGTALAAVGVGIAAYKLVSHLQ